LWFGLGVAVGAVAAARGRAWLAQLTPAGLAERAGQVGSRLLERARLGAGEFAAGRREAETALRRQAGLG
jgi:hypothetical protein